MKSLLLFILVLLGASQADAAEVIGGAAAGCVAGAEALPLVSESYQVLRPARQRYWGHSDTVAFVKSLAVSTAGQGLLLMGDMAQPRGGPMPSGHASHQNGLDVDIWFRVASTPLSERELANPRPLAMVRGQDVSEHWGPVQAAMLERSARAPEVERIFVNPVIKLAMCRAANGGERSWLGKLRPWWGHDEHFHVRLRCPADSPLCEPQKPFPEGDGCGEELLSWLAKPTSPVPPERPHVQTRPMPEACATVLNGK
ncbi:penicillin-insensitive murein endopeptidase [Paramagnetospirillum marisnigri]|uniref:Penicillin-insensitive murein endopeptidase n=1 Tax=Paramagnetospirillum marisnigri TaxID=1285242 RepID=A0A178M5V9_9PROT|nr:penicillin-insensitive murein endopeptidase [Paramagnetospirillum marisnigri]OAN43946.1 penicillin-insensitive murein endopeptidase [Paramagnetospirillum marisnigri]